jgi:dTDP-4-amino-4,6-dideoxygalactose transaminase
MLDKTFVTKSFLPPKAEFLRHIDDIYETNILTNQGPKVLALEDELLKYLNVPYLHFVTNGTIALQLALQLFEIESGEVITTPFSYVATTSSILWQRCEPVFVDIEPSNFTIDPAKIEEAIGPKTKAIMPVHVFGYACDVSAIQNLASKYNLKVIYDAAHTFGARYKGKSLCDYGDFSTLSFHATKIFHTIEGGACITNNKYISDKLDLMKRFGHLHDDYHFLGINAKQDEINASMGLANLTHINNIILERKRLSELYDTLLGNRFQRPKFQDGLEYNYSYYPILFDSQNELLESFNRLKGFGIFPRRYFYPSLNTLPYINNKYSCPISEDIASRIACLPLFVDLREEIIETIAKTL